jgi:acyl transferase domain-containing protein/acyl carrier protein
LAMYEEQLRNAVSSIRRLKAELAEAKAFSRAAIAVVGLGCRFPGGADSPSAFAHLLEAGFDAVGDVPSDRWDADLWYDADPDAPGKMNTRWGAFLDDLDQFDPGFFDLSDREAAEMDPQQRLLLEVAWESLEHAAIAPASLENSKTGVFIGINGAEYYQRGIVDPGAIDAHTISGGVASVAAGRIANRLGLNGPSIALDTACSSSLSAVHLACHSLRRGESNLALAGGVYIVLEPNISVGLSKLHMMAPDGRCKSFDAKANGFVQGEGAAMVVLKRLDEAIDAGDPVLAVIRGTAMNQDGRSASLTAPSRPAQRDVIAAALKDAEVNPSDVSFVETHGTGTALGDPIECHALADVFAEPGRAPLVLGAVKSNIGHLGPASGIAGLIKTVLVLQSGKIPKNLHLQSVNPQIDTGDLDLEFPNETRKLPAHNERCIAGVSSFGFSGTNVHIVLEKYQTGTPSQVENPGEPQLLILSARTASSLDELLRRMDSFLRQEIDFPAICRSAAFGRNAFEHRLAIVADSSEQARSELARSELARKGLLDRKQKTYRPRARMAIALNRSETLDWSWLIAAGLNPSAIVVNSGNSEPIGFDDDIPVFRNPDSTVLSKGLCELGISFLVSDAEPDDAISGELETMVADPTCLRGRLELLGRLFEHGFNPDWSAIFQRTSRIALPLTPFIRTRCWRAKRSNINLPPALPGQAVTGPLPGQQFMLLTGLSRHPFLTDHRVHGQALVPGAFQICCMMLAATKSSIQSAETLTNVMFPYPLILPEAGDLEIWTSIEKDSTIKLVTQSADEEWLVHAQSEIGRSENLPGKLDIEAISKRCREVIDSRQWRVDLAKLGIKIGPAFSGLVSMAQGNCEALAKVEPIEGRIELDGMIHPAFLDACLQTAGGALPMQARGKTLLPVGVEQLTIMDRPQGAVWVHARSMEQGTLVSIDLDITDLSGNVLVNVTGLAVSPLSEQAEDDRSRSSLFYRLEWREQAADIVPLTGATLILTSSIDDAMALKPHVMDNVTIAISGEVLEKRQAGLWNFDENDLDQLLFQTGPVDHIVFCYGQQQPENLVYSAMNFSSWVARLEEPPRVTFAILAGSITQFGEALAGLSATLNLEQPATESRAVFANTVEEFCTEVGVRSSENQVRIAKGSRHVARLVSVRAPCQHPKALSGSALVTGGFGGLGRALAVWLLKRGAKGLVLAGRNPDKVFAADLAAEWDRPVIAIAADVAKSDDVDRLLGVARGMPPLSAIYHAAGAQAPCPLATLSRKEFDESFQAKASAAVALHEATHEIALEEFVMISSIASILGAAGQGGYAPANAVLDSLARNRRDAGLPGLSVLLGRLSDSAMIDNLDVNATARIEALGIYAISNETALEAIGRALGADLIDPIIAQMDWQAYAERHPSGKPPVLISDLIATPAERPNSSGSIEEQVLSELRLVARIASAREIDTSQTLLKLGFDSLMAMELRNRLRKQFGKTPSLMSILGGGTIEELLATFQEQLQVGENWEELVI